MKNQEQQDAKPWGIGQQIAFRFIFVYLEGFGYGHITSGTSNFRKVNFSLDSTMNLTIKPSFDTTAIFEGRVEPTGDHRFVWQGTS